MSHRQMDYAPEDLRGKLAGFDAAIAAAKASDVVDLGRFAALRRRREALSAQLTKFETGKTWP